MRAEIVLPCWKGVGVDCAACAGSAMHQVEQSSAALLQMAEAAEPISYSRLARLFTCMRTLPLHLVISCAHVHVPVCVEMDAHHTCLHAM